MAARQTSRRQLQFSGFEMGLVAATFVVTVTAVFFLGLFVGRKNASFHAPNDEERIARIPVDDFTKYKRPAPIPKPPKPEPAAPAEPVSPPVGPGQLAAAKAEAREAKVEAKAAAAEAQKAAAAAAGVATAPVAVDAAKASAPGPDTAAKDAAAKEAAAKDAAAKAKAKEAAAKEAAAKEKEKQKAKEEEEPSGRGYTVQILATRKQSDADALVQKLKSRGYGAYIKKISDGEGAWYRVRVGSYGAFGEARAMADRCRHDLGLGQAFVSTE